MRCFHAHIPSHSPTHSHMTMPSVSIINGNTNDTHIPSLYRLTNTQCKSPMGNQSRVNLDSYHPTLVLSDKYDRVFYFGQQEFRLTPRVSYTHTEFFGRYHGSLTPKFQAFHLRGLTAPFFLRPTYINYYFTLCFES